MWSRWGRIQDIVPARSLARSRIAAVSRWFVAAPFTATAPRQRMAAAARSHQAGQSQVKLTAFGRAVRMRSTLYHAARGRDARSGLPLDRGSYGLDHLDLVLAKEYLSRILANARVHDYLEWHHKD